MSKMPKKDQIRKMSESEINNALSITAIVNVSPQTLKALENRLKEIKEHHCSKGSPCYERDHNIIGYGSAYE